MVYPRKQRAQAKSAIAADDEEESHDVAYENEDEDEEDEDDFVPDDEEEEDSGGEGNESAEGVLEGHLYFDEEEGVLHYQGDSFHFSTHRINNGNDAAKEGEESKNAIVWNPLRDPPPSSNTATYRMQGTIQPPGFSKEDEDDDEANSKLPLRLFDVTWTITHDGEPLAVHHTAASRPGKKTCVSGDADSGVGDDEEEEDGKQKASPKRPALFYRVVGREMVHTTENVLIQFQGGFFPLPAGKSDGKAISKTTNSVPLNCEFQYVLSETSSTVAAAAAAPVVAVAAASAPDDDDDEDEADEGMGYDELIALHEDAGMDVEALKRRYQQTTKVGSKDDGDDGDGKPTPKKFKGAPKSDDDDDDDVGF